MKNFLKLAGAVALVTVPMQVNAATGNIPFNGNVADTCVVTVGTPGTLAANPGFTVLGSQEAGGAPGTATLLTTGSSFSLSADAPSGFSAGPGSANTNTTFAASYSASGDNVIPSTPGTTATSLGSGSTNVSINMAATKTSGTFEAGAYEATVILRCE